MKSYKTAIALLAVLTTLILLPVIADAGTQKAKATWKVGDRPEVEEKGKWYEAEILEIKDDSYKIHYTGFAGSFDEWVNTSRMRARTASTKEHKTAEWTWQNGAGEVKTKADFQDLLQKHQQWLASGGSQGVRADLTGANLQAADLKQANLAQAIMRGVNLTKTDLTVATLNQADLSEAVLNETTAVKALMYNVNLSQATLYFADLSGAILDGADLTKATVKSANLSSANLRKADLTGVKIDNSNLSSVNLYSAKLADAMIFSGNFTNILLGQADMTNAYILGGDWTNTSLVLANLSGVTFEPEKNPEPRNIANALNLERVTYANTPDALTLLRNALKESGFRPAQEKVTYALKHRENELRKEVGQNNWYKFIAYAMNLVFFDWTVQYGMRPERALVIVFYFWFIFAVIYDLFIHFPGRSGIFLVKNRMWKNAMLTSAIRVRPRFIAPASRWKYMWRVLRSEWRVFRISMFFSATSALHIGYGALDLGNWIRMLTKREYDLRPKHWTRTLSGLQSLISLYLVAMWMLTEFGDPFE